MDEDSIYHFMACSDYSFTDFSTMCDACSRYDILMS